MTGLPKNMR
jgi:hypothetical protein